jgi:hypothetical protein
MQQSFEIVQEDVEIAWRPARYAISMSPEACWNPRSFQGVASGLRETYFRCPLQGRVDQVVAAGQLVKIIVLIRRKARASF